MYTTSLLLQSSCTVSLFASECVLYDVKQALIHISRTQHFSI